jgi:hypothetical protein
LNDLDRIEDIDPSDKDWKVVEDEDFKKKAKKRTTTASTEASLVPKKKTKMRKVSWLPFSFKFQKNKKQQCTEPIEEDEDEDEVTIITPPPRPSSHGFPHHQVSSCLRHQPPLQCMIRPASRPTILPLPFLNKYFNPFATQGQKRQPIPSTVTPCLECFPPKRVTVDVKRMKNYFKETQEKDQQQQPLAQDVETPSR